MEWMCAVFNEIPKYPLVYLSFCYMFDANKISNKIQLYLYLIAQY